jgi:ribosome-associated toxin RatA of RatAB toxin-antitoxin module
MPSLRTRSSALGLLAMVTLVTPASAQDDAGCPPAVAAKPAAAASLTPSSNLPPLPVIDRIIFAKLHAGIVFSEASDDDGHGGQVHGQAICHCNIDALWAVLTHHANFVEFVPRVTQMEVTRHTDHGERALQTIDASISNVKYALDYEGDPAARHIAFLLAEDVPHDLKAVRGDWQMWPIDHGAATLIEYRAVVDTGRQIPSFIKNYLADRGVKDNMQAMCSRAEGKPSNK